MRLLALCLVTVGGWSVCLAQPSGYPPVVLSGEHQEQVKVGVGETLPELSLPAVGGEAASPLAERYGEAGTVVVWFGKLDQQTKSLLRDLTPDIVDPYAKRNLAVVPIAVGEATSIEAIKQLGFSGEVLVDAKSEAFSQVGSESLPRVYVLDAKGKIVWFDIEYSLSTRRELAQVLKLLLPARK